MNKFYNLELPIIETRRLVIRPFVIEDSEGMYHNWASDPRVTKYLTWQNHKNVEETKSIIERWINDFNNSSSITYGIEYRENSEIIGSINCFNVDLTFKKAEIGYCLSYNYWNNGLMTEALRAFICFCFETLKLETINACHHFENLASGRVMLKSGMKYVSSSERLNNIQIINYTITKEDWLEYIGIEKKFVIIDNKKEIIKLDTLISVKSYQNTLILTLRASDYSEIERDEEILKQYYKEELIGYDALSLEQMVVSELVRKEFTISCAESCTGGMIISKLINVSGASNVINESYVTYSEDAKVRILGVKRSLIDKRGVASIEVAEAMAIGVAKITKSDVTIGVTGFAGSSSKDERDGLFYFAIKIKDYIYLEEHKCFGPRNQCREAQTRYILWRLNSLLKTFKS